MTKKIIEYGFMGDEQGITYVINHKPDVINNKYKFYKVIEKEQQIKNLDEKENLIVEPKKVENKFIKKPEVISSKKDESKPNIQNESKPNIQNESKPNIQNESKPNIQNESKPNIQNESKPNIQNEPIENDNAQNKNLLYGIPVIIIILLLIIYYLIPSSKSQIFGKSQI
jgi:hypothetical protein